MDMKKYMAKCASERDALFALCEKDANGELTAKGHEQFDALMIARERFLLTSINTRSTK